MHFLNRGRLLFKEKNDLTKVFQKIDKSGNGKVEKD